MLLRLVCCAPTNNKIHLTRIRTRKNNLVQLNKTLNDLSVLMKTSTASRGVIAKVDDALYDITLLSKTIHVLDVEIEEHD